jgi:hypothetical protein
MTGMIGLLKWMEEQKQGKTASIRQHKKTGFNPSSQYRKPEDDYLVIEQCSKSSHGR